MPGLRNAAIRWYRKAFGAPAGSDIRDEGFDTVLDGNSAVAFAEAGIASHEVKDAEGPRGTVAAATGLALTGNRATAFLSGQDIAAAQDLLISAAGKHAPLVLHLGAQAAAAHGSALGSAHDTVHLGADTGVFIVFAANVQQAADFTVIARRVAEEALVPGIVVMDAEQTALAAQDVRLLSPAQLNGLVGSSRDRIETPTAAQRLLFGETRQRLPAWHDLDEPVLIGALFDKDSFALGAYARAPFFDAFVDQSLATAFEQFERKTGRRHERVSRYRLDDAKTVLVAQGAAIETARVAADCLRRQHKIRAGVLGIHVLRPFPGAPIAEALEGHDSAFVFERVAAPLGGKPPLTREVEASLDRDHASRYPECSPVMYGIGGLPLRVADIVELCSNADPHPALPLFLGLTFDDTSGEQPKREVMLDALRRAYPDAARRGIRAKTDAPVYRQDKALTIAIHRSNRCGDTLAVEAGTLLRSLEGGRIRSRPAVTWEPGSGKRVDWLIHGDDALQDPGDGLVADVTLDVPTGTYRVEREPKVFRIDADRGSDTYPDTLLGGLFGVLTSTGLLDAKARRLVAVRRASLDDRPETDGETLTAAFQSGFEQVAEQEVPAVDSIEHWDGEAPASVRHLARDDNHFASLPRFWDQAGVLYRDHMAARLSADPYLATGTMPPLSSTFSDLSDSRTTLPVFDPAACTGCGLCWTHCPDSAIGVVAAAPAALIDAGIRKTGAEAVRQVASKLASRMIAANRKAEAPAPTFGAMLSDSFSWLIEKAPLPEDRKQAIEDGVGRIREAFGELPVAVTRPFFQDAEAHKKDSAQLLSLVINPDACKACGICVKICEPAALETQPQDPATLKRARELWSIWTATPDTPAETLERVARNPDFGPMAAILLSRYCQFALAGGDAAEAGSGEKMAVRLALSATEFHQQPVVQRFAKDLHEAGEALSTLVRETLSGTLAVEDLDAVTESLKRTTSPRVDLQTLAEAASGASADHSIDTRYVLRLIDLSNRIESAHHRLVKGEHGLGRARYGLAIAGGSTASWAGAFPHNPFQAPVLIDMSGDAAQLAAGLIEGQLEETKELIRLLRLARLEVDRPNGLDWKREALSNLRWQDMSEEEFKICPPLLLIGSDEMLVGRGLSQLIWLLNSGLPVKVIVLSALDFDLIDPAANNPRAGLGLLAVANRSAFVAQTSVAHPTHFVESMLEALGYNGPALLQVYAPSPARHGFGTEQTLEQAELAVASRALPLFRYDPTADGVFGARISLDGNPQGREAMVAAADGDQRLTPADWALRQDRFSACFPPLADDAQAPVPLHEWLMLDSKARSGKTPYIVNGGGEDARRYAVAPAVTRMADERLQAWRTLQELAGLVTPFTERLEQEIRSEVAAEHQAELDALKRASAAEILEIQKQTQAEIAGKIRSRLLELASRKRD